MFGLNKLPAIVFCTLVFGLTPWLPLNPFSNQAEAQRANQLPDQQQNGVRQFGPRVVPPRGIGGQPGANRPPPKIKETHGDWAITCESNPQAEREVCVMAQAAKTEDGKRGALTLIIANAGTKEAKRTILRVIAPIGIYLPLGVALEIDGAAVARVPYTQCVPQACFAIADAREETLAKLRRGSTANFIVYSGPGKGISMEISLKGFTAAKKALDAL